MNAIRTIGIHFASLALIGVAEAQKGGGKPGGGTPTPYSPVIVNVSCDGTGTKLQDALNALNPVANVYEVRVSGVCPEDVEIKHFLSLRITSSDTLTQAKIGTVAVQLGSDVTLEYVELVGSQSVAKSQLSASSSVLRVDRSKISCATGNICSSTNIKALNGAAIVSRILTGEGLEKLNLSFDLGAIGVISFGDVSTGVGCPALVGTISVRQGSNVNVSSGCAIEKLQTWINGSIFYQGSVAVGSADVYNGGSIFSSNTQWYSTIRCSSFGVVGTLGLANHCVQ